MNKIKITQLWAYPIKSMRGVSLKHSTIEERGLLYDRQWMLVDENNQFLSQRRYPQMAVFAITLEQTGLVVSFPEMEDLHVPFFDSSVEYTNHIEVGIWEDKCQAIPLGSIYDQWFSEVLNTPCRLVFMPDSTERVVDENYTQEIETTRFSDGFPFLLLSEESLIDLNTRLLEQNKPEITMEHFRPNIVVSGSKAYDEDLWTDLQVEKINFSVVKPCTRCVITTINPNTGKSIGKEPLKTLNTYRKQGKKVIFGQNMICCLSKSEQNVINIGQEVILKSTTK